MILSEHNAAQQTLSKARDQAKKNNYPFFLLITSTPNGTAGTGKWFYKRWMNAVDSDLLFKQDENGVYRWDKSKDLDKIVADRSKNTFVKIKYHWSEDPTKDEEWYNKQCQELDDQRLINQELDLYFVGGTNCIFKDETLANFKSKEQEKTIDTPHFSKLKVFEEELSKADYYLIGCDTAESLEGAYCAIQIFSFRNFKQIAEVQDKYGSYTAFADVIDFVFNWLRGIVGDNIILCIENNSIGRAPIEILRQFKTKTDYDSFIYRENEGDLGKKPENYGIKTTGLTKPLMAGCLMESVGDNIPGVKSRDLIDQFSNIERTNSGGIKATGYSDLFMSACFCAYVRNKKAFQILPIIEKTPEVHYSEISNFMTGLIKGTNVKEKQDRDQKIQNDMFIGDEDQEEFILPFDSGADEQESNAGGFLGFFGN